MDATSRRSRWRPGRRRHRRHGHSRSRSPASQHPETCQPQLAPEEPSAPPPPPPHRFESLPEVPDQYVENKMGLPPPYEQAHSNPAPPPSYFGANPPPPPGFVAPAAAPRTTVITNPTSGSTGPPVKVGPGPTGTTCASCHKNIVTRVDYVPNNKTHIVSAALCVLAGCCCGCFVPYCMRSCKTANHYCPQCRAFVGSYTPS